MTDTPQDQQPGQLPEHQQPEHQQSDHQQPEQLVDRPAGQPTEHLPVGQPTNYQPAGHQPTVQLDAFGQPLPAESSRSSTSSDGAIHTAEPLPWNAQSQASVSSQPQKRSIGAGVIAGLVAAGLIGGLAGAGVAAWAVSANQPSQLAGSPLAPQNITVNDTAKVNLITAVAAKASPSVVTISVTGSSASGTGSGVILTQDGYVVTNTHVVTLDGSTSNATIRVETSNGQLFNATVVGTDPVSDLAVIKLTNASGLTPATFGNSNKLNVGETAIASGAPLGLANTVTNGIVSAINRSITIASSAVPKHSSSGTLPKGSSPFDFWNFGSGQPVPGQTAAKASIAIPVIQTDAPINPGNSGGALLNASAQVIGLNVAIATAGSTSPTSQSGSIGVGFAIPSSLVQRIAHELIKNGKATHGLLGASVYDATSDPSIKSSSVVGASIAQVSPGGAAAKAGLQAGDIVTSFNGMPITGNTDLTAQVRALPAGATAPLTYLRNGKSATVSVTLGQL